MPPRRRRLVRLARPDCIHDFGHFGDRRLSGPDFRRCLAGRKITACSAFAQAQHRHGLPTLHAVPHLTVAETVAFPLRVRRRPDTEVKKKVADMLALVRLESFAGRLPGALSGGQQQRVALARALAYDRPILLMDEPLSALDKKLRGNPGRNPPHPSPDRRHYSLRHPRSGRGAASVGPNRPVQGWPHRADRHRRGSLSQAGDRFRCRLHRQFQFPCCRTSRHHQRHDNDPHDRLLGHIRSQGQRHVRQRPEDQA